MFRLIGFNEGSEHIQFVPVLGAWLRVHELFNAMQSSFMVSLGLNGSNSHGASWDSDGRDIDGVTSQTRSPEGIGQVVDKLWGFQ
jgi:hypothetical protein